MKLIVAGSRFEREEWDERLEHARSWFESLNLAKPIDEVVSGTARGYDRVGEALAKENGIHIKHMPADWDTHGKPAGYIRNKQMAAYADALLVYWNGVSKGTKHMIDLMEKAGKPIFLVNVKE